jgi:hypothetical protein
MQCPYCQTEMEMGKVLGNPAIGVSWFPFEKELPFMIQVNTKEKIREANGIELLEPDLFPRMKYCGVGAYACRMCKKIIIDF